MDEVVVLGRDPRGWASEQQTVDVPIEHVEKDSSFSHSPAGQEGMPSTETRSWRGAHLWAEDCECDCASLFEESWDYSRGNQAGSSKREPGPQGMVRTGDLHLGHFHLL